MLSLPLASGRAPHQWRGAPGHQEAWPSRGGQGDDRHPRGMGVLSESSVPWVAGTSWFHMISCDFYMISYDFYVITYDFYMISSRNPCDFYKI